MILANQQKSISTKTNLPDKFEVRSFVGGFMPPFFCLSISDFAYSPSYSIFNPSSLFQPSYSYSAIPARGLECSMEMIHDVKRGEQCFSAPPLSLRLRTSRYEDRSVHIGELQCHIGMEKLIEFLASRMVLSLVFPHI